MAPRRLPCELPGDGGKVTAAAGESAIAAATSGRVVAQGRAAVVAEAQPAVGPLQSAKGTTMRTGLPRSCAPFL